MNCKWIILLLTFSSWVPTPLLAQSKAETLLIEAKALFEDMEYDAVIPKAEAVVEDPDSTTQQKLDAYLLKGSSLVIIGNSVDASIPFRSVLRISPNHELPPNESPKIVSVFNLVKQEEQAIRDQTRAIELGFATTHREQYIRQPVAAHKLAAPPSGARPHRAP